MRLSWQERKTFLTGKQLKISLYIEVGWGRRGMNLLILLAFFGQPLPSERRMCYMLSLLNIIPEGACWEEHENRDSGFPEPS